MLGFNRPKRLLVFINPIGGRKLGRKIYTEQVQPLFELANIKVDIIGELQELLYTSTDSDNYNYNILYWSSDIVQPIFY